MISSLIQAILTVGCLVADYFNCKKMRVCFIIWAICNIGWFCVDLINGAYSRMILDTVQMCFNVYGLIKWSNKMKGGNNNENE
ncbi:MAG: nicotinamide mononucleotide transporter [Bacteroidales bacterium]|nr:nicotinamide mononucleotide transporter [Bacteroidales bacterium]